MRRIAVINQKGGVGKTTSCCNIGAMIAAAGHRVLLIDLDPQAHLTMHLGVEPDGDKPSIYNVLTDNVPLAEAFVEVRPNLTLVPSHIDLAAAEMELVTVMGREVILRDALAKDGRAFDFLVIDCPPSLGVLTINGLAAVHEIVVPMQPHFLALQGVGKLLETIGLVRDRINRELVVSGIVLCMYEAGTRLAGEVSADLAAFLEQSRGADVPWSEAVVYRTIIRRNIKLAECPSHGQTIAEYAPHSNGAIDYAAVTAEILGVGADSRIPALQRTAAQQSRARPSFTSLTPQSGVKDVKDKEADSAVRTAESAEDAEGPARKDAEVPQIAPPEHTEKKPERELVEHRIAAASEAMPTFDAGDRVAFGPDTVVPQPVPIETGDAALLPSETNEAPADAASAVAAQADEAESAFTAPTHRPVVRRSIPIFYEEESDAPTGAEVAAHTGVNRG
jgi:chromosome partitioning protein